MKTISKYTLCLLSVVSLPAIAQEEEANVEIAPEIIGDAHHNSAIVEDFIAARFASLSIADPERLYDPFGMIKDSEIKLPEPKPVVPVASLEEKPVPQIPAGENLKNAVQQLKITGVNSSSGTIIVGSRELKTGDKLKLTGSTAPVVCSITSVTASAISFKELSSGEEYTLPVGLNPAGIQTKEQFLNSIQGVQGGGAGDGAIEIPL